MILLIQQHDSERHQVYTGVGVRKWRGTYLNLSRCMVLINSALLPRVMPELLSDYTILCCLIICKSEQKVKIEKRVHLLTGFCLALALHSPQ